MADRMTTDAPSPERVAVEQVDREAAAEIVRRSMSPQAFLADAMILIQAFARHRIVTAQASAAEIERLKGWLAEKCDLIAELGDAEAANASCFSAVTKRALAAEAESARLREALESAAHNLEHASRLYDCPGAQRAAQRSRAALAAGASQEVGRG